MSSAETRAVVVLYGSQARGDGDALSDRDLLVVGGLLHQPSQGAKAGACIVKYSWAEFEAMHEYGSLFLVHLAKEGSVLEGDHESIRRYGHLLQVMPSYTRGGKDLLAFGAAIADSEDALRAGDTSVEFELANIATVVRHCSILGCYLAGQPTFGRYEAVKRLCKIVGAPDQIGRQFPHLYNYRLALARNLSVPAGATIEYAIEWCRRARSLVEKVGNQWTGFSRRFDVSSKLEPQPPAISQLT
jgi:hypothetical protein